MIRATRSAARRPLSCFSPIASAEQKNKINPCTVPLFHHHQLLPQRKTFHDRPGWICGKSENGKLEEPGWGKNSNIHCFFLTSSFLQGQDKRDFSNLIYNFPLFPPHYEEKSSGSGKRNDFVKPCYHFPITKGGPVVAQFYESPDVGLVVNKQKCLVLEYEQDIQQFSFKTVQMLVQ